MNIEQELALVKYHLTLLTAMVDKDEYPFFTLIISHGISEHQSKTLVRILTVFHSRRVGTITKARSPEGEEYFKESRTQDEALFGQYGIPVDEVYQTSLPSYKEFELYSHKILGEHVPPHFVLSSMKDQNIHADLASFLLVNALNEEK